MCISTLAIYSENKYNNTVTSRSRFIYDQLKLIAKPKIPSHAIVSGVMDESIERWVKDSDYKK